MAVRPIPVASLTLRLLMPIVCVNRNTSRIFFIDTLSAGIAHPLVEGDRSADSTVDGAAVYAVITC